MQFIQEVTKKTDEPYLRCTLYQLCMSIQKYLDLKKIPWKIVKDQEFKEVQIVLENVMKRRKCRGQYRNG